MRLIFLFGYDIITCEGKVIAFRDKSEFLYLVNSILLS